jgi:tetratricopeptide (TPR) repeat protein
MLSRTQMQMLCPRIESLKSFLVGTMTAHYEPDVLITKYNEIEESLLVPATLEAFGHLEVLISEKMKKEPAGLYIEIVAELTANLVDFTRYCWLRNIFVPQLLEYLKLLIEKLNLFKSCIKKNADLQQFLNIRIFDLQLTQGMLYISNNQLKEAEICLLNASSKAIYLRHSKEELVLLNSVFCLVMAEIHLKRGHLDVAAKLIEEVIKRETLPSEILSYFRIPLKLACEYEQKKSYQKAIFWYKQYYLMYIKACLDGLVERYFKKFKIELPIDIKSTFEKIKELKSANIQWVKQKIMNINDPSIIFNEESSSVSVRNYGRANIMSALKKYELVSTENEEEFQVEINEVNTEALLHAVYYINKHFNLQETKTGEPETAEISNQYHLVVPIPTQLEVTSHDIEQAIVTNASERLPSQSSSKNDRKKKNKASCTNSAVNKQNPVKIKITAEQLGFSANYHEDFSLPRYNKVHN